MDKRYAIGLVVLLVAFSSLGLTCEKVTDPQSVSTSGYGDYEPPFDPDSFQNNSTCQAACNEFYNELLATENERHRLAMKECKKDKECKKAETKLHQQNVKDIQAARQQCIRDCHDQGGTGGDF